MPIRLLAPEVASQIAAGEVVERPASVVKELVENALDAGAKSLTVNILEAGRRLIEVSDDGGGIPADELPLAVERHATSKLQNASELFSIHTLGFRGEALASIASVSRLTITSRVESAAAGARIRVDAGLAGGLEPAGAPVGSTVRVEDLFYNVPARLKFLKQDLTERRAIDGIITRYALAYPQVRFRLAEGANPSLQTPGDGDRRAILAKLYGVEVAREMLEVNSEEDGLKLSGFISPASLTRSNRKEITFFINGRWVADTPLTQGLLQAYHTLLMVGRYPLTALFLEIDPQEVDVNVHPAKAQVRFKNQDRIFSFIQRSARRTLLAYSPVPAMPTQNLWSGAQNTGWPEQNNPWNSASNPSSNALEWALGHDAGSVNSLAGQTGVGAQSAQTSAAFNLPIMRLVGQIGSTYLIAEGPDGLYLIDQHAAHERVLFEKLMAQHERKAIASQTLLSPVLVQVPPASARILEEQLPVLQHFGFSVEAFGPNAFQVRAIPQLFAGSDPAAALRALVEDFEEDEAPLQNEIEAKIAARVCKRMAVKGGKTLSTEEQRALLTDLENCNSPRTCPHGRPTMIHLSVDVLERQFGRKGAR
jgi:DNA mismatch repair protein MutL